MSTSCTTRNSNTYKRVCKLAGEQEMPVSLHKCRCCEGCGSRLAAEQFIMDWISGLAERTWRLLGITA